MSGLDGVDEQGEAGGRRISCVICAYNEADRISEVLRAVHGHPALAEVIVVDDGSSDGTAAVLRQRPGLTVISLRANMGKTHALREGISRARSEFIMLLDADLTGVRAEEISSLCAPVLRGAADVTLSLRGNSLWLYRQIGLDFLSGERVLPRQMVAASLDQMSALPAWGGEASLNRVVIDEQLRVAVVAWPNVHNTRKQAKRGFWAGLAEELQMVREIFDTLSLKGIVQQNMDLLRLAGLR